MPWVPGKEPAKEAAADPESASQNARGVEKQDNIALACRSLMDFRDNWLYPQDQKDASKEIVTERSLTELYNHERTWLGRLQSELDEAVLAAYGWTENLSDDAILRNLLALNRERAGVASALAEASQEASVDSADAPGNGS